MTSDPDDPISDSAAQFGVFGCEDWWPLLRTRANVLVTAPNAALRGFMNAARAQLREPIAIVQCGTPLALEWASTLVLMDVDQLDPAEQKALFAWIADPAHADTQIISFTSAPLFAAVQAGTFDRELFYRLNTIHIEAQRA